jgi:thiamine transport system substrate-binding protein
MRILRAHVPLSFRQVRPFWLGAATLATLTLGACSTSSTDASNETASQSSGKNATKSVTLAAYDSFLVTDAKFSAFTKKTGIKVNVVAAGDTGEMVNKAVLTKANPIADVLWGVDTTFLDRTLNEDLFTPVSVPTTDLDPELLSMVTGKPVVPVDFGDVCVNYDKAALAKLGVAVPASFSDLTKPEYKGMLVVQNPATSSVGLSFLLASIASSEDWQTTWKGLKNNDVLITNGWSEAYETHFTAGGNSGDRPMVVSYGTSPVAAVLFGPNPKATESPTAVIESTCFRSVEFAGVLSGTNNVKEATQLLEYLVSPEFQTDIQLNMFVYPANIKATPAPEFDAFAQKPATPLSLDPGEIATKRDGWIDEWSNLML